MKNKKVNFGLIMIVYLLGIFMGAIDTGIVTPARTIIQSDLMVDENTGIWMITIYTLAYAASIPIMGKLADKYGRKYIYLISIFLFGIGSLFCGLSQNLESCYYYVIQNVQPVRLQKKSWLKIILALRSVISKKRTQLMKN